MPRAEPLTAGLWPRAVAWCIDAVLVAAFALLVTSPWTQAQQLLTRWRALGTTLGTAMRASVARGEDAAMFMAGLLAQDGPLRPAVGDFLAVLQSVLLPPLIAFLLLGLAWWPLQEASARRATVGKRLVGLQVLDAAGARLSLQRAVLRHLAGSLSWLTLNIGHLLAARGPDHRALHDRIAGTQACWRPAHAARVPAWGGWLLGFAFIAPLALVLWAAKVLVVAMEAALTL